MMNTASSVNGCHQSRSMAMASESHTPAPGVVRQKGVDSRMQFNQSSLSQYYLRMYISVCIKLQMKSMVLQPDWERIAVILIYTQAVSKCPYLWKHKYFLFLVLLAFIWAFKLNTKTSSDFWMCPQGLGPLLRYWCHVNQALWFEHVDCFSFIGYLVHLWIKPKQSIWSCSQWSVLLFTLLLSGGSEFAMHPTVHVF